MNNYERRLPYKNMYLTLYCKCSKRVTQGFTVRGSWRPNKDCNILIPLLWPSALCLSRSPDAQPEGQRLSFLLSAGFLYHILSPTGLQNYWGSRGPLRPGVAFPTTTCLRSLWSPTHQGLQGPPPPGFLCHILSATSLDPNSIGSPEGLFGLAWLSLPLSSLTPTVWLLVLTELYNSSTPTQSLEWHVWSSSSGNNCLAVHWSLSSGSSVYECTMGCFTLSHFISQTRPRDLFRLLSIGMCHFLPVHHFRMACLPGTKVKIQHLDPYLIMLSVKQGSIKYHFWILWYDLTWDWTPVTRIISEHSTHLSHMARLWPVVKYKVFYYSS